MIGKHLPEPELEGGATSRPFPDPRPLADPRRARSPLSNLAHRLLGAARHLAPLRPLGVRVTRAAFGNRPWRAAVADFSMEPSLFPGDFLLLDPTTRRWPKPGSIVVVREPRDDRLVIKRVGFIGPGMASGHHGVLVFGRDQAWLVGDASTRSLDSRSYGGVPLDRLVARAWFRYWPPERIGLLPRAKPAVNAWRLGPTRPTQPSEPSQPSTPTPPPPTVRRTTPPSPGIPRSPSASASSARRRLRKLG